MSTIQEKTAQIRKLCDEIDAQATTPPPVSHRRVYFGYFGDNPTIVGEVRDHATMVMPFGWPDGTTAIAVCQAAKAAGLKIMLPVWGAAPPSELASSLEYFLKKCEAAGVLDAVIAIYPQDEPDVAGMTDAQVRTMCATIRTTIAKFPPIANAPLAAIYGNKGWPGISAFDWIGHDDYGAGPQALPLEAHQRLMIVPGGANTWRESPDSYVNYAQQHAEVVAVVAFMWQYPDKPTSEGIKGNGMAPAYKAAGTYLAGLA